MSLSPIDVFLRAAGSAHIHMPAQLRQPAHAVALEAMAHIGGETGEESLDQVISAVLKSGCPDLVEAVFSWRDRHPEAWAKAASWAEKDAFFSNPGVHTALRLTPTWAGTPCARVGALWLFAAHIHPDWGFVAIHHLLDAHRAQPDAGTDRLLLSLLAVEDVWQKPGQEASIDWLVRAMLKGERHTAPAVWAALAQRLSGVASPATFIAAYRRANNYRGLLVLRAFQPTSTVVQAVQTVGVGSVADTHTLHAATRLVAGMITQDDALQAFACPDAFAAAVDALRVYVRHGKPSRKKGSPADACTPEAQAKRAARAAKRAAAAAALPTIPGPAIV